MLNFTGYNSLYFQICHGRTKYHQLFRSTRRKIISCAEAFNRFAIDFLESSRTLFAFRPKLWVEEGLRNLPYHFAISWMTSGLMAVVDALSRYIFSLLQSYEISIMYSQYQLSILTIFVKNFLRWKISKPIGCVSIKWLWWWWFNSGRH
jgi:hypothetical protein